jgi:hypothetical protein
MISVTSAGSNPGCGAIGRLVRSSLPPEAGRAEAAFAVHPGIQTDAAAGRPVIARCGHGRCPCSRTPDRCTATARHRAQLRHPAPDAGPSPRPVSVERLCTGIAKTGSPPPARTGLPEVQMRFRTWRGVRQKPAQMSRTNRETHRRIRHRIDISNAGDTAIPA